MTEVVPPVYTITSPLYTVAPPLYTITSPIYIYIYIYIYYNTVEKSMHFYADVSNNKNINIPGTDIFLPFH